jgi:hypothetical protein
MSPVAILVIIGFAFILGVLFFYIFKIRWERKIAKQDGLCPHCGEPLRFWQSIMTRSDKCFHADCAVSWDSNQDKKRIYSFVDGKVVCLNCNEDYDKTMKNCPRCGTKN